MDERLILRGVYQLLQGCREVGIGHTVEGEQGIQADGIADLAFLGILLGDGLVGDLTTEIAVVAQHGTGHGGTEGWVHLTHEHRGLAEGFGHPLGKLRVLAGIFVIDPEVPGPGHGIVTAAEERTVGLCGKG